MALREMLERVERIKPAGAGRQCVEAGLWLLAGEWERAHDICQDVPTAWGSAWHAVVHRREGDFWNSHYWWRKAGGVMWDRQSEGRSAIVHAAPAEAAAELKGLAERWEPGRLVDLVERHRNDEPWREVLVALQRWEWTALFLDTWERG